MIKPCNAWALVWWQIWGPPVKRWHYVGTAISDGCVLQFHHGMGSVSISAADACPCIPMLVTMAQSAEKKAWPAVESDGRWHHSSLWHLGPSNCWPHQQSVAFAVRPSVILKVFHRSKNCRSGPQATWVSVFKENGNNVLKLSKNVQCSLCFELLAYRSTSLLQWTQHTLLLLKDAQTSQRPWPGETRPKEFTVTSTQYGVHVPCGSG